LKIGQGNWKWSAGAVGDVSSKSGGPTVESGALRHRHSRFFAWKGAHARLHNRAASWQLLLDVSEGRQSRCRLSWLSTRWEVAERNCVFGKLLDWLRQTAFFSTIIDVARQTMPTPVLIWLRTQMVSNLRGTPGDAFGEIYRRNIVAEEAGLNYFALEPLELGVGRLLSALHQRRVTDHVGGQNRR
jgi:hypothetical protein